MAAVASDLTLEICRRIKLARIRSGMEQRDFAAELGVTVRTVANYEKTRVPWKRLGRIAEILNVDRDWLIDGEEAPPRTAAEVNQRLVEVLAEVRRALDDFRRKSDGDTEPPDDDA